MASSFSHREGGEDALDEAVENDEEGADGNGRVGVVVMVYTRFFRGSGRSLYELLTIEFSFRSVALCVVCASSLDVALRWRSAWYAGLDICLRFLGGKRVALDVSVGG